MAYRRRQGNLRSSTVEEFRSNLEPPSPPPAPPPPEPGEPPSLAAQAMRASSAHRDSSISSAYGESGIASAYKEPSSRPSPSPLYQKSYRSPEGLPKAESPHTQRSPDSIASSLTHIGGTIKNAIEGGLTIVENRTADIIQETRKLNIRRKGSNAQNQATDKFGQHNFSHVQADHETQLKASRDVANAMAAKAKLLLRELKTVKADLAFAKERCAQLEEENKMLRESHEKGHGPEDDDLIRLQLETLLAEKGRLAHENSVYARENRFLREIVEYHQLTMQDVVYVDEGIEEVTEVFSNSPSKILSRTSSLSSSSHGASASLEHPSPAALPLPFTPTHTKPRSIVVPEACPIGPTPPTPSPRVTLGAVSYTEGGDDDQQL